MGNMVCGGDSPPSILGEYIEKEVKRGRTLPRDIDDVEGWANFHELRTSEAVKDPHCAEVVLDILRNPTTGLHTLRSVTPEQLAVITSTFSGWGVVEGKASEGAALRLFTREEWNEVHKDEVKAARSKKVAEMLASLDEKNTRGMLLVYWAKLAEWRVVSQKDRESRSQALKEAEAAVEVQDEVAEQAEAGTHGEGGEAGGEEGSATASAGASAPAGAELGGGEGGEAGEPSVPSTEGGAEGSTKEGEKHHDNTEGNSAHARKARRNQRKKNRGGK